MTNAGCKINLGLKIIGKRKDGYHEITTIFYPLETPSDQLFFEKISGSGIQIECVGSKISLHENILTRVWQNFSSLCKPDYGIKITLIKRIPIGAGLGGGSSDAASFLLWLNRNHHRNLNRKQLYDIAFATGADVPFFLDAVPSIATGAGEKLRKIKFTGKDLYLVLIVPDYIINTAWVFHRYDEIIDDGWEEQNKLTKPEELYNKFGLSEQEEGLFTVPDNLDNDLEKAVFEKFPELGNIKTKLLALGAMTASMSGSGSSIYGIFKNRDYAKEAQKVFKQNFTNVYFIPMRNY